MSSTPDTPQWQSLGSFFVLQKGKGLLVRLPFYSEEFRQLARSKAALWDGANKAWAFKNMTPELIAPKLQELERKLLEQNEAKKNTALKFFKRLKKLCQLQGIPTTSSFAPPSFPLKVIEDSAVQHILQTTSISITFKDSSFFLAFPFNENLIARLKSNRGQFLPEQKQWKCPATSAEFIFQLTLQALKEFRNVQRNRRLALDFETQQPYPPEGAPIYYFFDKPSYDLESDTFVLKSRVPLSQTSVYRTFFEKIDTNIEKLKQEVFFEPSIRRKNLDHHFYYRSVHKHTVATALAHMNASLQQSWSEPQTYSWSASSGAIVDKKHIGTPFIDLQSLKIYQVLAIPDTPKKGSKKNTSIKEQALTVTSWTLSELLNWHAHASSIEINNFFELSRIDRLQFSSIIEAIELSNQIPAPLEPPKKTKRL